MKKLFLLAIASLFLTGCNEKLQVEIRQDKICTNYLLNGQCVEYAPKVYYRCILYRPFRPDEIFGIYDTAKEANERCQQEKKNGGL